MASIVAAFGKYGEDFECFFVETAKPESYMIREFRIIMQTQYPGLEENVHYVIYHATLSDEEEWDEDSALDLLHQARVIDYKNGKYPVLMEEGELV